MHTMRDGQAGPIMGGPVSVTASDATIFPLSLRGLYVGVSGNVAIVFTNDESITLTNLAAGVIHPITNIKKILATGTTATGIVGFTG